ncbi:hypothetical protein J2T13_005331 [Paenibacillus sp. DS2015]
MTSIIDSLSYQAGLNALSSVHLFIKFTKNRLKENERKSNGKSYIANQLNKDMLPPALVI